MRDRRLHSGAWQLAPMNDELNAAIARYLPLQMPHPDSEAIYDACLREFDRATILETGGFND